MSAPEQNLPKFLKIYIWIIVSVLMVGLFFIAGNLVPYEPFTHYGWEIEQDVACPLEPLDVTYTSKVDSGPYNTGTLEGELYWISAYDSRSESAAISIDASPHPKTTYPSTVSWNAEPSEGKWYIELDGVVSGYMFGVVPTSQPILKRSTDYVIVINDSGRCKDNVYLPD